MNKELAMLGLQALEKGVVYKAKNGDFVHYEFDNYNSRLKISKTGVWFIEDSYLNLIVSSLNYKLDWFLEGEEK